MTQKHEWARRIGTRRKIAHAVVSRNEVGIVTFACGRRQHESAVRPMPTGRRCERCGDAL